MLGPSLLHRVSEIVEMDAAELSAARGVYASIGTQSSHFLYTVYDDEPATIMSSYISTLLWGTSQLDDAVGTSLCRPCILRVYESPVQTRLLPSSCRLARKTLRSTSRYLTKFDRSLSPRRMLCVQ